LKDEET